MLTIATRRDVRGDKSSQEDRQYSRCVAKRLRRRKPQAQNNPPLAYRFGRALATTISDRLDDFRDFDRGSLSRDAIRRILAGDVEGALMGVRIRAVPHPAVLLALTDCTRFQQHGDR